MSGDYSLWKQQDMRREANKGLTGRGFVGCISIVVSAGIAYGIWTMFLQSRIDLRSALRLPATWPDAAITGLAVIVLFVAVQLTFTILLGILWKLTGKDQKVEDKMDELADTWDQQ